MSKLKLALDAGHGLHTAGKRVLKSLDPKETREWTLNNRVVVHIIKLLQDYEGVEIIRLDDPTGKIDIPLAERVKKANDNKVDVTISTHHNAGIRGGTGGGMSVYRYPNSTKTSKSELTKLYNDLILATGLKGNRASPISEAYFYILRYTNMKAILIEGGFMDSKTDVPIILTQKYSEDYGQGVVNWLVREYKLVKKVKPIVQAIHRVRVDGKQIGAYSEPSNILNQVKKNLDKKLIEIEKI